MAIGLEDKKAIVAEVNEMPSVPCPWLSPMHVA